MHHLPSIQNTDIYLIDQILKGRYNKGGRLLDAGCGGGRNLSWFVLQPAFYIYATDINEDAISKLPEIYPVLKKQQLICAPVQDLPFSEDFFDHIICSTVLHFAGSTDDFFTMFSELTRVLQPGGSLFIRMASDIGLEPPLLALGNGRFTLPDGSDRFLLSRDLIAELASRFPMQLVEPVKTTNVQDIRCMTTLVLRKYA